MDRRDDGAGPSRGTKCVPAGPAHGLVGEQPARLAQLRGEDHRRCGQLADVATGLDRHPKLAGTGLQRAHHRAPAAERVARCRRRAEDRPHGSRPHERCGEGARVVVEAVHAGRRRKHRGGALVGVAGSPGTEVQLDGSLAAPQPQHRRDRAQRRRTPDLSLPAKLHTRQRQPGIAGQQLALRHPTPEWPVLVEGMGTEVGLVRAVVAARPATERSVCLQQRHVRAALGACDRRRQSRETSADDGDLVGRAVAIPVRQAHHSPPSGFADRINLRSYWSGIQFQ